MTDTPPERIWATGDAKMTTGSWNDAPVRQHPNQTEYILEATHTDTVTRLEAQVAELKKDAMIMQKAILAGMDGIPDEYLRALSSHTGEGCKVVDADAGEVVPSVIRMAMPMGETVQEMRNNIRGTAIHEIGDARLMWVNEGDMVIGQMKRGVEVLSNDTGEGG